MGDTVTPNANEEVIIVTILVSDILWGGFMNLHITDKRIVVESVMKSADTAAAFASGGIAGALIAQNVATKIAKNISNEERTIDQILGSSVKNFAINHGDISNVVLKRKALPIGCSRFKIKSRNKKVTYAFKREIFDDVLTLLNNILLGKVTVK